MYCHRPATAKSGGAMKADVGSVIVTTMWLGNL